MEQRCDDPASLPTPAMKRTGGWCPEFSAAPFRDRVVDRTLTQIIEPVRRVLKYQPTLVLAEQVVTASNPEDEVVGYFPSDTLFTPYNRERGLPLGNQTSQFFANVNLNSLDHPVLSQLQPRRLDGLRLSLHEGKSRIHRASDGITFLGWRITPEGTWMKR